MSSPPLSMIANIKNTQIVNDIGYELKGDWQ